MNSPAPATTTDSDQLRVLSILHYVLGGITALFSVFFLFYVVMGVLLASGSLEGQGYRHTGEEAAMGWFMAAFGVAAFLAGLALSVVVFMAAHAISHRKKHTFCVVVAALSCPFFPFGTALGVFTLIVLTRSSVKAQFDVLPAA